MNENHCAAPTLIEQDLFEIDALRAIARLSLIPDEQKIGFETWESESGVYTAISVYFAPGEDPSSFVRYFSGSGDHASEVRLLIRDPKTVDEKLSKLYAAGFWAREDAYFVEGFWRSKEGIPVEVIPRLVHSLLCELEDHKTFPAESADLIANRYLSRASREPVAVEEVRAALSEVWERVAGTDRKRIAMEMMVDRGWLPAVK